MRKMLKIQNLGFYQLCFYLFKRKARSYHSLALQALATQFYIPGPTTVVGGDELSKASSMPKNTGAKQNLVEMRGSTKAPTRHNNWMTKRRAKGCSGPAQVLNELSQSCSPSKALHSTPFSGRVEVCKLGAKQYHAMSRPSLVILGSSYCSICETNWDMKQQGRWERQTPSNGGGKTAPDSRKKANRVVW